MCDVGYLCANFSLPRPLCSRLRPDVRDRQTSDSYWKQGSLGATGVKDWLQLGRRVRRTADGAYCVATRTACLTILRLIFK